MSRFLLFYTLLFGGQAESVTSARARWGAIGGSLGLGIGVLFGLWIGIESGQWKHAGVIAFPCWFVPDCIGRWLGTRVDRRRKELASSDTKPTDRTDTGAKDSEGSD